MSTKEEAAQGRTMVCFGHERKGTSNQDKDTAEKDLELCRKTEGECHHNPCRRCSVQSPKELVVVRRAGTWRALTTSRRS